jgi:hypothetical protein
MIIDNGAAHPPSYQGPRLLHGGSYSVFDAWIVCLIRLLLIWLFGRTNIPGHRAEGTEYGFICSPRGSTITLPGR